MNFEITSNSKRVVLITGCSSGLGLALTKTLIESGRYYVVATARKASLESLRAQFQETDEFIMRELDVTIDQQIYQLINEVCRKWGKIDVLVNNAGVCFRSVVEHMDEQSEMIQLKSNYLGPMSLIRGVLPIMRERRTGHIINISSVSGMVSMPTMASYSASKHALEGASEALWYETRPYGINVSLIQPGFIRSDSFTHVKLSKKSETSLKLQGPHSEYYDSMTPFIEKLMSWSPATPEKIAVRIMRVMERKSPPLWIPVTFDAIVFRLIRRLLPSSLFHKIMFLFLPNSKNWGRKKGPNPWRANRRRPSNTPSPT